MVALGASSLVWKVVLPNAFLDLGLGQFTECNNMSFAIHRTAFVVGVKETTRVAGCLPRHLTLDGNPLLLDGVRIRM